MRNRETDTLSALESLKELKNSLSSKLEDMLKGEKALDEQLKAYQIEKNKLLREKERVVKAIEALTANEANENSNTNQSQETVNTRPGDRNLLDLLDILRKLKEVENKVDSDKKQYVTRPNTGNPLFYLF